MYKYELNIVNRQQIYPVWITAAIIKNISVLAKISDTSFSVMAVTPQTHKYHHNRGCASVVVTFWSLWCHSHDQKRGVNFYSIMVSLN